MSFFKRWFMNFCVLGIAAGVIVGLVALSSVNTFWANVVSAITVLIVFAALAGVATLAQGGGRE